MAEHWGWRRHIRLHWLLRILLVIAVWSPEVAVAYTIWNMPIWFAGTILGVIFCIVYGFAAVLGTIALAF